MLNMRYENDIDNKNGFLNDSKNRFYCLIVLLIIVFYKQNKSCLLFFRLKENLDHFE